MRVDVKSAKEIIGKSNIEIALDIGVCPQWLTNIQRGDKFPKTLKNIIKLSELSGIPIDDLIIKDED